MKRRNLKQGDEPAGDGLKGPRGLTNGCLIGALLWLALGGLIAGAIWASHLGGAQ